MKHLFLQNLLGCSLSIFILSFAGVALAEEDAATNASIIKALNSPNEAKAIGYLRSLQEFRDYDFKKVWYADTTKCKDEDGPCDQTKKFYSLLMYAAGQGKLGVVKYLIEEVGIPLNQRQVLMEDPTEDIRALHERYGNANYPAPKDAMKAGESFGTSSLDWAAKNGKLDVVKYLLQNGAVVDVPQENIETAFRVLYASTDGLHAPGARFTFKKAIPGLPSSLQSAVLGNNYEVLKLLKSAYDKKHPEIEPHKTTLLLLKQAFAINSPMSPLLLEEAHLNQNNPEDLKFLKELLNLKELKIASLMALADRYPNLSETKDALLKGVVSTIVERRPSTTLYDFSHETNLEHTLMQQEKDNSASLELAAKLIQKGASLDQTLDANFGWVEYSNDSYHARRPHGTGVPADIIGRGGSHNPTLAESLFSPADLVPKEKDVDLLLQIYQSTNHTKIVEISNFIIAYAKAGNFKKALQLFKTVTPEQRSQLRPKALEYVLAMAVLNDDLNTAKECLVNYKVNPNMGGIYTLAKVRTPLYLNEDSEFLTSMLNPYRSQKSLHSPGGTSFYTTDAGYDGQDPYQSKHYKERDFLPYLAAMKGSPEMLKLLIDHGANFALEHDLKIQKSKDEGAEQLIQNSHDFLMNQARPDAFIEDYLHKRDKGLEGFVGLKLTREVDEQAAQHNLEEIKAANKFRDFFKEAMDTFRGKSSDQLTEDEKLNYKKCLDLINDRINGQIIPGIASHESLSLEKRIETNLAKKLENIYNSLFFGQHLNDDDAIKLVIEFGIATKDPSKLNNDSLQWIQKIRELLVRYKGREIFTKFPKDIDPMKILLSEQKFEDESKINQAHHE